MRVAAALIALGLGGGFLILAAVAAFRDSDLVMLGRGLFGALTWPSRGAVLGAGLFRHWIASARRKREGTLGPLFLTSCTGTTSRWQVAGHLASERPRVVGRSAGAGDQPRWGRDWAGLGADVDRLVIALLASWPRFIVSHSAGIRRREWWPRWFFWCSGRGQVAADGFWVRWKQPNKWRLSRRVRFGSLWWRAEEANAVLGWGWPVNAALTGLLGVDVGCGPHTWQQRPGARGRRAELVRGWRSREQRRAALRRVRRNRPGSLAGLPRALAGGIAWILAIFLVGSWAAIFATGQRWVGWFVWGHLAGLVTVLLYLGAASEGARLFLDARRSGLLETRRRCCFRGVRFSTATGVRGFGCSGCRSCFVWRPCGWALCSFSTRRGAKRRRSLPPRRPRTAVTNAATTTNVAATMVTTRVGVAGSKVASLARAGLNPSGILVPVALALASLLTVAANLVALGWYGMWMGLNSKSTNLATLKTVLFVQIVPWFFIMFASALSLPLVVMPMLRGGGQMIFWYPIVTTTVTTLLCLAKDVFFILYAKGRLNAELRAETRTGSGESLSRFREAGRETG